MNNASKMTLEKLARMIKNGFDETGEKINNVEKELKEFKEQNSREHEEMNL
ncbi:hypothetical protein KJ695_00625 [Patescibacteria group bacterium]|nr:hypothetical protein [Patescibacteria group bacterium]MBU4056403.1 hypothetical protein [Patescibacteria group bacterium]MBU4368717.1 hypothetical protein [Patescibacteria group bacterium]